MNERRPKLPLMLRLLWPEVGHSPWQDANVDWDMLNRVALQHRLAPLLHRQSLLQCARAPQRIADRWRQAHAKAEIKALHQKVELARVARALTAEGIPVIALKGSAIRWRGWFEPALRPMRDIDVLVRPDHALQAHRLLRAVGYRGPAATSLSEGKHLPAILSPEFGVPIEIHAHLIDPPAGVQLEYDRIFRTKVFAGARSIGGLGGELMIPDDTDTLVHIVRHGVLDHQFNNGPLLIFDTLALIRHGKISWDRFWQVADTTASAKAARLSLELASSVDHTLFVDWQGRSSQDLPSPFLEKAARMMLVDMNRKTELGALGRFARFNVREMVSQIRAAIRRNTQETHGRTASEPSWFVRLVKLLHDRAARRHIAHSLDIARWLRK